MTASHSSGGHLDQRPVAQDAGVVDQRVQLPVGVGRGADQLVGDVDLGAVAEDERGGAARRDDLVDHRLPGVAVELGEHDRRPLARQLDRLAAPDAAARPGHDGHPAVKESHGRAG